MRLSAPRACRVTAGPAAEAGEVIVGTLVDLLSHLSAPSRAAPPLTEIGDCRARFPEAQALAAAGVAPSARQSGKHRTVA
jgi:hypothetical protein